MICVAHLVREANGAGPFHAFLESYRRHRPGAQHELVLLLKGFESPEAAEPVVSLADGLAADTLFLPDSGFDVGSYIAATRKLTYDSFCFLNSFSVIRSADWLGKMAAALDRDVGIVGASGSCASHFSMLAYDVGFGPYRKIFRSRTSHRAALEIARARAHDSRSPRQRAIAAAKGLPLIVRHFDQFPSYHVRTNAFLVRHDVIRSVHTWSFERKVDAWRFESGRQCLLRQVERNGLRAAVVGADGQAYEKKRWHESNTFWQSQQQNLVVEDNQSRDYRDGDANRRLFLSLLAWGEKANPELPIGDRCGHDSVE